MSGFPVGWPPRPAEGRRSIRAFTTGTATANYYDNAVIFSQLTSANQFVPTPIVPPGSEGLVTHNGNYLAGGTPSGGGQMTDQPTISNMIWAMGIRVVNTGITNSLNISFDGINTHGVIAAGKDITYLWRHEAGIAVQSVSGTTYQIEAW